MMSMNECVFGMMAGRKLRHWSMMAGAALMVGCNGAGEESAGFLEGRYEFIAVNDHPPPVEFPVGSGDYLDRGTLDLLEGGEYSLRFDVGWQPNTELSVEGGKYRVAGDTLYLSPEGSARDVTKFQYVLDGTTLWLSDGEGNAWRYTRTAE